MPFAGSESKVKIQVTPAVLAKHDLNITSVHTKYNVFYIPSHLRCFFHKWASTGQQNSICPTQATSFEIANCAKIITHMDNPPTTIRSDIHSDIPVSLQTSIWRKIKMDVVFFPKRVLSEIFLKQKFLPTCSYRSIKKKRKRKRKQKRS